LLKVRKEQIEAFKPQAEASFVSKVVDYLRENHADVLVQFPEEASPVKEISEERLREMARNGIARARAYGMTWESSITAFVVLMFVIAPNFDDHPLIHRVLSDEKVGPNSRIDQLWERTSEENWKVAKQDYNRSAWRLEPNRYLEPKE
jgi:hypothetical protein